MNPGADPAEPILEAEHLRAVRGRVPADLERMEPGLVVQLELAA